MTDDLDQIALHSAISRPAWEGPSIFSSARLQTRSTSRHSGSPQFMAAYEVALSAERPPIGRKHKEGTIGDLVTGFYRSSIVWCLTGSPRRMATA
jgi:hypothetical protein